MGTTVPLLDDNICLSKRQFHETLHPSNIMFIDKTGAPDSAVSSSRPLIYSHDSPTINI